MSGSKVKRFLAVFLTLVMFVSCLPFATIAEETSSPVIVDNGLPEGAIIEVHEKVSTPKPTEEPTPEPTKEPTPEPTAEPEYKETQEIMMVMSLEAPAAEPVADPTAEPAVAPTVEPAVDPTAEPVADPTVEPVADPTAEPVADPTAEPVADLTVEPVADPTVEPVADPTVEPVAELGAEPTADPTVEPVADPTVEPTVEPESGKYAVVVTVESGNTYTEYHAKGEVVTLKVPSKEHYTFLGWRSEDVSVIANRFTMPDHMVNVSAEWEPEVHAITIYYLSTTGGGKMPVATVSDIEYGHSFELADSYSIPHVDGFTAFKITHGSDELTDMDKYREFIKVDSVEKDERFYVYYEPAEVQYVVKRYMQLVDGTYSDTADETTTNYAKYGDKISASNFVESYTGFTWDNNDVTVILSSDAANNVIRLYYLRNSYNLNYQTTDDTETQRLKYGEAVNIASLGTPTRAGYTFNGWKLADGTTISNGYTMPAHDVTLFADWAPANVSYTIRYWHENIASANNLTEIEGYDYIESATATALTGSTVSGSNSKSYTGFEFDHADTNVIVKADGSTVVNVYYKRSMYKYEFYDGNQLTSTLEYKYGADLSKSPYSWPIQEGYEWYLNSNPYGCPKLAIEGKNVALYKTEVGSSVTLYGWYEDGTSVELNTWYGATGITWTNWRSSQRYTPEGYTAYYYGTDNPIPDNDGERVPYSTQGNLSGYHILLKKNSYILTLNNGESDFAEKSYLYGDSIANALADMNVSEITPPAAYTGYNFAGWTYNYQSYSLEGKTMPTYNMVLVATWKIPVYTVNFYEDDTMSNLIYSEEVQRSSTVQNDPNAPTREGYEFGGWYYMDGNVEKLYFDGKPITKSIDVYAKWIDIDNRKVDITVKHEYYEADGTTFIRSETETIQVPVGTVATVYSKSVSGFYPELLSQNIEALENQTNEVVFKYLKLGEVQYTVHYVDQNGMKLIADKVETTSKMDIVEVYEYIPGATPRTISQSLRLTANPENNVITFVYDVEGTSSYVVNYYLQNADGTYSLEESVTIENVRYYTEVFATEKVYEGFEYDESISTPNGWVLPNKSLVLSMYYERLEYTVTYVYKGTVPAGVTALPAEATYLYGTVVTVADVPEAPKGYTFEGWNVTNDSVTVSEDGTFEMPRGNVVIEGEFIQAEYWIEVEWEYVDGVYCGGMYTWDCDKLEYVYSSGAGWKTEPSITFTVTNYGSKSVNLELSDEGQAWNKYLTAAITAKADVLAGNGASKQISFSGTDFAWDFNVLNATTLNAVLEDQEFVVDENTFNLNVTKA